MLHLKVKKEPIILSTMKKTTQLFLFICLFNLGANYSKAQYVTIPDANFANWLNQQYPGAMNGNLMDTTNFEIVTTQSIFISFENFADLTGLNYFDNLLDFYCRIVNYEFTSLSLNLNSTIIILLLSKLINVSYNLYFK